MLVTPKTDPLLLPLLMVMLISALCSHQPRLLPEVTSLEKLLLNLMRWVVSLSQRKLMTTETLLNFISSDCRTWHLKPRLCNGDSVKNGFEDGIGGVLPLELDQRT